MFGGGSVVVDSLFDVDPIFIYLFILFFWGRGGGGPCFMMRCVVPFLVLQSSC